MKSTEYLNKIEDYKTTVHAILGFINFYRFDDATKTFREDVLVFQGRHLDPSPARSTNSEGNTIKYVTPDFGVLLPTNHGVLGEAKKSFPKDATHWMDDFAQLMSYDDDLTGWPSRDGKVQNHDIVLLVEQARAVRVREFFEKNRSSVKFMRPFVIVEFNRADEGSQFYFFRRCNGTGRLSEPTVDEALKYGTKVPMEKLVASYSVVLIYDDEPPLPYMIYLIWEHIVIRAASDMPKFELLKRKQKMQIDLKVEKIARDLHEGFSFRTLHGDSNERQPEIPRREWVERACEELVVLKEAEWLDDTKKEIRVFFRKYDDVLTHFVDACAGSMTPTQGTLFNLKE
jgi:hypothetical protein